MESTGPSQPESPRSPLNAPGAVAPSASRNALDARLAALANRRGSPPPRPREPADTGRAPTRSKRRHAAKGARATALGLSLASTGALAAMFTLSNRQSGSMVQAATIVASPTGGSQPAVATTPAEPATSGAGADTTIATADAATADAVVQGAVFHNKWGDVQVQATFSADGQLIDVTALQTPYRDDNSVRINDAAVPQLNAEALTAQSAQVDTVSGATYTSDDYRRSLQSAIDAANSAGLTTIAS